MLKHNSIGLKKKKKKRKKEFQKLLFSYCIKQRLKRINDISSIFFVISFFSQKSKITGLNINIYAT
jgi:hypothetical protein